MKQTYILGIDIAKHKVRAALSNSEAAQERLLFEKDLPVNAGGLTELLLELRQHVAEPEALLVLIEATGLLHLNWAAALSKAGYAVVVINPLIARRLYTPGKLHPRQQERSHRCAPSSVASAVWHGEKLLARIALA